MPKPYVKPKRYVPGPGEPALPPQLSEFQNKSTDDVMEELNRMPFFMSKLDGTDGEGGQNVELEALKALAYEGEPHEVAENFKNQGNDLYRAKRYKDAREIYNRGIDIKCDDSKVNESLFSNRAACELELKNYRRCVNDCKRALQYNVKNIKCYYRIAKAFLLLNKLEDAKQAAEFGLKLDPENQALNALRQNVDKKKQDADAFEAKKLKEQTERERLETILEASMILRNFKNVDTANPPELLEEAKICLENKEDMESQLIFPAMVLYPISDEFDFIGAVGELSTPEDLLNTLLQRPEEWFEQPGHEEYTAKKLFGFMETEAGGLIKVGKKVTFHDVFKMEKPSVPLFDKSLRIYFVPKSKSEAWLAKWDKEEALKKRK
ncbi:HSP70/90 family co-chaperone CNS1 [Lachancea thermotolerans CBS 6340]|uniref:KLTH0E11748p n=1 Tax=Lachancea thermotolerans (strain ATCC 56472 / CBS 6340 / NRRL Y-8284) TaxID=559295 RepID=C5DID9_LACTC|nr:KLTH0E11748p [Lachancea thermotolerans CBS 6340]CAR23550.1 KLTH0E11748p [Lachancea thermotolerans CBS 6340]